jgi:hypothetical protein
MEAETKFLVKQLKQRVIPLLIEMDGHEGEFFTNTKVKFTLILFMSIGNYE